MSKTEVHRLFCTECGNEGIPIRRRTAHKKEAMHLKKLYCIYCNKEINHVEIAPDSLYQIHDFNRDFKENKFKE